MVRIHTIALNGKISLGKVIKFVTKFNGAFALPKSSWCVHEFQGAAGGFQLIMNTALFDLFIGMKIGKLASYFARRYCYSNCCTKLEVKSNVGTVECKLLIGESENLCPR